MTAAETRTVAEGDRLPEAKLLRKTAEGPEEVPLGPLLRGRRVVIFGLPGAFTPTCDAAHLPSFIRTAEAFRAKGIDEIVCVSVNDVHVMRLWGEMSGAEAAGITMLADSDGAFTRALGLEYSNRAFGMHGRSRRYALLAEDGVVTRLHLEQAPGVCELSAGEAMLATL